MRVVLDTNILATALLVHIGYPGAIYRAWSEWEFVLLTCTEQLDDLRATLRKPANRPYQALQGRAACQRHQAFSEIVGEQPKGQRSPDATDDFLLALCEGVVQIRLERKRFAMEAARRTQLAKGEVGIRDLARVLTLAEFAEERFRPFVRPQRYQNHSPRYPFPTRRTH